MLYADIYDGPTARPAVAGEALSDPLRSFQLNV